jgi:membrane associated rhomboid family serine protease
MLPIGDDNSKSKGKAHLTWIIIALNVAVYVIFQGFGVNRGTTLALAVVPSQILAGKALLTLLTSQFAHANLAHLAGNMLFLAIFGDNVECRIGKKRFLALYLLSGIAGALAHTAAAALAGPQALDSALIGASAAISGVLAAYLVLFPGNKVLVLLFFFIPTALSAWMVIGFWFVLQVLGGLAGVSAGGVAYLAHLGGFLPAFIWARYYRSVEARRLEERRRKNTLKSGSSGDIHWWIVDGED